MLKIFINAFFRVSTAIILIIAVMVGTGMTISDWYYWIFVAGCFIYGFTVEDIREYFLDRLD